MTTYRDPAVLQVGPSVDLGPCCQRNAGRHVHERPVRDDHKADAEAFARVERFVDALSVVTGDYAVHGTRLASLTLADLRRVVNMAGQIGDAR